MLSCKHASRLISRAQDEALPAWSRGLLRLHLAACDGCTRFKAQVLVLRHAMQRYRG
jgi:hypothetical protein